MANMLASVILGKAAKILQDTANIRWPESELLGWLNDGQREIAAVLPELTAVTGNIPLALGTRQALPTDGLELLKLIRNMGATGNTPGRAIRHVPASMLDSHVPDWHSMTAATEIKHCVYDTRAPKVFYVYPPAAAGIFVEALYSVSPADIAASSSSITLDDIYAPVLMDYVLYRAYSKDIEIAGNMERAASHHGNFVQALSAKKAVAASDAPTDAVKG
jgi:hypothetical protein